MSPEDLPPSPGEPGASGPTDGFGGPGFNLPTNSELFWVLWRRSVEPSATGSGRSSSEPFRLAPESRGRPSNHANRPAATNGPAPATCCTSTPSGLFASAVPATPSPVTATAPAPSCACGLASNGVHSIVDDHSRYAYSELHRDERAPTVTGFLERGLAAFAAHGIEVKRLMSDNAWTYTHNRALAAFLAPPPPGQRQGRAVSANPQARVGARAAQPHSSLGGQTPISRVHNLRGRTPRQRL